MSLAMELCFESVASSAQSLRNIAFRSASPFNSRIRYVSQPYGFRDQSHGLFYQSPVCKHSKKSARTAMAEIASDIASVHLEQDLLQQLENLKLQMKEKKRELKEHRKALKAAAKAKKSHKKMGDSMSSSSSSESSNSDEEDCNTFDMRAMRQKEAARIMKEKHLPQETLSIATIESRQCSSSQVSPTELKAEPVELNSCSCSQNMQIVSKSIEPKQCVSSPKVPMESKPYFSREETLAAEETVSIATKELRQCSSNQVLPTELNCCSSSQERTIVSEPVELNSCSCSQNMLITSKSIGSKPGLRREETLAAERIEVCVGGSCRKAGSKTLLGSLQEKIPANSGACAVACKCMGRCGKSINVRIVKDEGKPQFHSHAQVDDADWLLRHHFGAEILPIHLPSLDPSEGELTPMVSLAK